MQLQKMVDDHLLAGQTNFSQNESPYTPEAPNAPKFSTNSAAPPTMREPVMRPESHLPSFKKGTPYVPKTGVYKLHKGEAVIPKEKNMHKSAVEATEHALSGGEKKPEKKIKHIMHRRGTDGSHIFEHHHHHPEHHPMEEHTKQDTDSAVEHFMQHGTDANPGEAAAEAGTPDAMAAAPPAAGAVAAPPMPMAGA